MSYIAPLPVEAKKLWLASINTFALRQLYSNLIEIGLLRQYNDGVSVLADKQMQATTIDFENITVAAPAYSNIICLKLYRKDMESEILLRD